MRSSFALIATLASGAAACAGTPSKQGPDDAAAGPADARPIDAVPFFGIDGGCAETPAWTGTDKVAASASPPGGLTREQVPQFVSVGFDDNFQSDAILWATDMIKKKVNPTAKSNACTYDGMPVHASFYLSTVYITEAGATEDARVVKAAWHKEYSEGNEMADHTHLHAEGQDFTVDQWKTEIQTCVDWLTKPFDPGEVASGKDDATKGIGIHGEEIIGFRTPFLGYSDKTFEALKDMGFHYDCTVEEGFQGGQDGTNYNWPYTLDTGSPADSKIKSHPGLWELPVYAVIVPPDDKCAAYGVPTGLRAKMKTVDPGFDEGSGKITGLDYNLWILYQMNKAEFVATLKYTLDQHLAGNRTPFMLGAHPDLYSVTPPDDPAPNATYQERRAALEEFLDYALSKPEVRVVPNKVILDWLRKPVAM